MLSVKWIKSTTNNWLSFQGVNLDGVTTQGVYIIWHQGQGGKPGRVVYVGQGDVAARLKAHRTRRDINNYAAHGNLMVTWAAVSSAQRDGVEHYLAQTWNPQVGDAHPTAAQIACNSPW